MGWGRQERENGRTERVIMEEEIAAFEKNSMEEVRIKISEWKSQKYLDIRVWTNSRYEKEGESKPTKKGITLNVELLPELLEALKKTDKAIREAKN